MILGPDSPCFSEINTAVAQLQRARGDERPIVFHWQWDINAIPDDAIIYNFDIPLIHFDPATMRAAAKRASEVWDFSKRNVESWRRLDVDAKHAPLGYHASMSRFERGTSDVDVVFVGCVNERRRAVLDELEKRGAHVVVAPPDRAERDRLLARCKTSINMLFYEVGVYPMLRAAHLLANDVPYVGEISPDDNADPTYRLFVGKHQLVDEVMRAVRRPRRGSKELFMRTPMVLP